MIIAETKINHLTIIQRAKALANIAAGMGNEKRPERLRAYSKLTEIKVMVSYMDSDDEKFLAFRETIETIWELAGNAEEWLSARSR